MDGSDLTSMKSKASVESDLIRESRESSVLERIQNPPWATRLGAYLRVSVAIVVSLGRKRQRGRPGLSRGARPRGLIHTNDT